MPNIRPVKDAARWVDDMITGVRGSTSKYEDGVRNPSRDPKQAALASADRWKDSVQKAISQDSFRKGVASADYDKAAELAAKSSGKLVAGVEDRKDKISATVAKLQPLVEAHKRTMDAIPVKSDADAEKKMIENLKGMRAIGDKMRG